MYKSTLVILLVVFAVNSRPVRRTMNFNMFVLKPDASDRLLAPSNSVSRFGPLLEFLAQRFQGMLSVKNHPQQPLQVFPGMNQVLPVPDTSENEVDGGANEAKIPGLVVKPSRTKPGTYEVEIAVVVDDEAENAKSHKSR